MTTFLELTCSVVDSPKYLDLGLVFLSKAHA